MPDKSRFPQIPSTVWWGLRTILQRTPNTTVDERLLGIQLNVQEAAARAYINELKTVGILTEEGKATPLAQKWRLDESYAEAVTELIEHNYPDGLRDLSPPGEGDRQKVVNWFLREGLGQGAAGNKAATYFLLGTPDPNEAPVRGSTRASGDEAKAAPQRRSSAASEKRAAAPSTRATAGSARRAPPDQLPLNVNVQIHISADAGSEQIEAIFQAMRRYLYDNPDS